MDLAAATFVAVCGVVQTEDKLLYAFAQIDIFVRLGDKLSVHIKANEVAN